MYRLVSRFQPKGDQVQAIEQILDNLKHRKIENVLLGATGTGKTFTIANIIKAMNKQVLIISHNKTLAIQIFAEMKNFFPHNRVEYFISPFDFYQPEAYLPNKDIYIDKSVKWNLDIKKMRMNALNAILSEESVIVVSTVAAIYSTANPMEYQNFIFTLSLKQKITLKELIQLLINCNYERNDLVNSSSKFMVKGNVVVIGLVDRDALLQVVIIDDHIVTLNELTTISLNLIEKHKKIIIYPGNEYVVNETKVEKACRSIEKELKKRIKFFNKANKIVESYRIKTRTEQDVEELREFGLCRGIENYALHFENRKAGEPAFTILDFFRFKSKDFITVIDESHVTIPQISGMYYGDRSRKQNLVDFGFRLPTAMDNRPLTFKEFKQRVSNVIYASATPGRFEIEEKKIPVIEQIVRPTGLLDPVVEVRSSKNQIDDLIGEIKHQIRTKTRTFILTLTIQMAEDLTRYLQEKNFKVAYLHSRLKTFQRTKILINLRKGVFDIVIGINLLREGLDIPEIALVAILDADKSGFLRDEKSLIQMIGRASRNKSGRVILYGDKTTPEMQKAINETQRRRNKQIAYNKEHRIEPQTIMKPIEDIFLDKNISAFYDQIEKGKKHKLSKAEKTQIINNLNIKMQEAIKKMDFELAAKIRDMIFDLMKVNIK